jgi:hypothetical protein
VNPRQRRYSSGSLRGRPPAFPNLCFFAGSISVSAEQAFEHVLRVDVASARHVFRHPGD